MTKQQSFISIYVWINQLAHAFLFSGLIVAELKQGRDLNREDRDVLCEFQLKYTAAYILSLGVVDSSR